MNEKWREALVPGARVQIMDTPCGLFDVGAVLVVESVRDETLTYHYAEGVWIDKGGELFPLWEMFGEGQCSAEAFGDGSVEWKLVQ